MKSRELRIELPLTTNEYQVGQNWIIAQESEKEMQLGNAIETLQDVVHSDGVHYTHKRYQVYNKIPSVIKAILSSVLSINDFKLHEESWDSYPTSCKTIFTNSDLFSSDDFWVEIVSAHVNNAAEDVTAAKAQENVINIDIFKAREDHGQDLKLDIQ